MINGKASMAWAGTVPWHGLGVKVADNLTAHEMMIAAQLDWKVEEIDTYAIVKRTDADGKRREVRVPTGMKALVRDSDDKVLTQVGKNWHPVQNEDAFDFFKQFIDAGEMEMNTAGSLNDGKMIFALAKVKDSFFNVFKGDVTEGYLLFSNPHEYGKSIDIRFTPVRVVCQNTISLALSGKSSNSLKVNHRRAFDAETVKETMGIASMKMDKYKEMAEFLGSKRTTKDTIKEYFGDLLGKSAVDKNKLSRTGEQAMELIETQPGANFAEGTWWQAFNTVTYMTNHILGRSNDTRMQSTWYGANQKLNADAMNLALEMADDA
jgi:phage/plasmid-like protein (TIGR03299 family)